MNVFILMAVPVAVPHDQEHITNNAGAVIEDREYNPALFDFTGSDFIKTSTGKEAVNATFPVAIVMARAIRDYYLSTGHRVRNHWISVPSVFKF